MIDITLGNVLPRLSVVFTQMTILYSFVQVGKVSGEGLQGKGGLVGLLAV